MEPWDGPAALAATDGRWVIAGMDRNGLRPMRYTLTADGLLVVGSETGMVPLEESAHRREGPGRPRPDDRRRPARPAFYRDRELKDLLAGQQPLRRTGSRTSPISTTRGRRRPSSRAQLERAELRRRQLAVGITLEDLELLLEPMVEDAKEAVGSMGDDTPLAVLSEQLPRPAPFLPPEFQPGHQPADRSACASSG